MRRGAAVDPQVCLERGRLTQQPGTQVEDATVTQPGVTMKGHKAEGGKIVQESVREAGEEVVVQMELVGPSWETGGQQGRGERPAAAIHLTVMTGARAGTC